MVDFTDLRARRVVVTTTVGEADSGFFEGEKKERSVAAGRAMGLLSIANDDVGDEGGEDKQDEAGEAVPLFFIALCGVKSRVWPYSCKHPRGNRCTITPTRANSATES
jgi:hypothetical protein